MSSVVYDKAKWHWGADNAPKDIPNENGATHIAFFLRWCIENKMYSRMLLEEFENEIKAIESGDESVDCRHLFYFGMDGVFDDELLNTKGKAFAKAYYTSEKTKFAKLHNWYLQDYADFVSRKFGEKNFDNAYFYIENSQENYQEIKEVMDHRYAEFLEMKAKK
ncbi:hypothetical protein L1281_000916 [Neisseria sp. HSC-16F19]|nr:hypothetical protein [Neisseria sp. HSC-16F19]MCP2040334.1 hypothetical protein [Neisseria sp. HSC-16F19]